ncbi:MAG: class I SAM-dependent methyltransferase [Anaerolineae bacterium]
MSFLDYMYIGREQRHAQRNPAFKAFYTTLGPLSTHARIRVGHVLRAVEELPLPPAANVLEAGSGRGYAILNLAQRHPDWRCVGVELEPAFVSDSRRIVAAEGLSNVRLCVDNLVTHVEQPASFDLILSGDVLEHIVEDEVVLANMYRWLKPGGWLVLHLPKRHQVAQRFFPRFRRFEVHDHVRDEYTEAEIREKLPRAGFDIVSITGTFGPPGELAFELNMLYWDRPVLRYAVALATFPVSLGLSYLDYARPPRDGNAFLIKARKPL